jgi:hypothetical protein
MRSRFFCVDRWTLQLRNRWFADSLLEGDGFEPSVPRRKGKVFPRCKCDRDGLNPGVKRRVRALQRRRVLGFAERHLPGPSSSCEATSSSSACARSTHHGVRPRMRGGSSASIKPRSAIGLFACAESAEPPWYGPVCPFWRLYSPTVLAIMLETRPRLVHRRLPAAADPQGLSGL